jgi:ankyrin repeat protein
VSEHKDFPKDASVEPHELFKEAFVKDDAALFKGLLERYPAMKARINEPVGPFDSPAITMVRSRAMLEVLLEAGANINARSRWWAGGFGLLDGAEPALADYAIKRGAVVDAHAAARLGMMDELRRLISAKPELVSARGGDGQTPLHFAKTIEIARYLLEQGADIDARDIDHESTPAQYMIRDRQDVARFLVQRGCATDILMAAALGELDLVRRHLERDPECIRMTVSERWFPKQNPRSGGTIYIWTLGQSKTAPLVARQFGHEEVFRFLMDRSPEGLKLATAARLNDGPLFKELLSARADVASLLSAEDRRALVDSAQDNDVGAVELMVGAGWPATERGQHGATALHWAAFHGNTRMVESILRTDPPLEATDTDFQGTPLGWAIYGSEHGWHCKTGDYVGAVRALRKRGAKRPEKYGGTAAVREELKRDG